MRDTNSLNKVILVGRLGQKPELKYLPQKERQVAHFTMATNERFFNTTTREAKDRTEWHKIVVWGKQAEFCEKYLDKGKLVLIEGKLRTRSWQDKDGNKRTTTEVEAENITLLGKREGYGGGAETPDYEPRPAAAPAGTDSFGPAPDDDFPQAEEAGTGGGSGGGTDDDVPF